MGAPKKRDDNWIDGLRGVASFIVVTGHICTCFVPYLLSPAKDERGQQGVSLFQYPIFRLCVSGRAAVAIFFLITGFVNSLNPVKNARAGNTAVGLKNLARSTFTRSGRLIVPTTIATLIGWSLAEAGVFGIAARSDSDWIRGVAAPPDSTWDAAFMHLFECLTLSWNNGKTDFDKTHWTLVFFLKGSMRVYLALLAMTLLSIRSWYIVTIFLYMFSWCTGDCLVGTNIYAGIFLAQLQVDLGSRATALLPKVVPSMIIITSLFACSYPQENQAWKPWSKSMMDWMISITPGGTEHSRYWMSVGATMLIYGLFFSRNARKVLTMPLFNFLGRVSFPVYLLHDTVIRTVLVWMVYGPSAGRLPKEDAEGRPVLLQRVSTFALFFIMPIFYATTYLFAYMWNWYVDPKCAKVVDWLKNAMFENEADVQTGESPTPLVAVTIHNGSDEK
ncbi:hypothetical protein KEM54_005630 [Ascosphaera aggregata]|nr:hypothetical protein KEM54_005630 [Ascosphaera aggregata]